MFTAAGKLFYSCVQNNLLPKHDRSISDAPKPYAVKNTSGETYYTYPATSFIYNTSNTVVMSIGQSGIVLGKGTTEPTENDYVLENMITGGISVSSVSITYSNDEENDNIITNYNYTVTNNGGSPLTITEVGQQFMALCALTKNGTVSTSSYYRQTFLAFRELLKEPVTIPAGESRVIRISFVTSLIGSEEE